MHFVLDLRLDDIEFSDCISVLNAPVDILISFLQSCKISGVVLG